MLTILTELRFGSWIIWVLRRVGMLIKGALSFLNIIRLATCFLRCFTHWFKMFALRWYLLATACLFHFISRSQLCWESPHCWRLTVAITNWRSNIWIVSFLCNTWITIGFSISSLEFDVQTRILEFISELEFIDCLLHFIFTWRLPSEIKVLYVHFAFG